ncbi:DedA family protein [Planctomonas sp. JC2975]|uniref:VTT domain-containing protein n=1 Tax=Planctomonas sp. JC2975 TaxID=2729626 RepID=UPI001476576F|nr:DedA family protein [Planctomonas sp. JC2975]
MFHTALIPWLDPSVIINSVGPWSLLVVCGIIFAETGLLVGFIFPGDTLLVISGILTATDLVFGLQIWWVCILIAVAAFLGGEVGYLIGHKAGPAIFERKETGLFSIENVKRTNKFFERFGPAAVILARFVPVVRTFAPVAAGVGHMSYRRYSLYNAIGAVLWGAGLTFFAYLIGFITPVANFVEKYIDLILILAVLVTVVPALIHYFLGLRKARVRAKAEASDAQLAANDAEEAKDAAERLATEPTVFGASRHSADSASSSGSD